jgi:hypothetical protein
MNDQIFYSFLFKTSFLTQSNKIAIAFPNFRLWLLLLCLLPIQSWAQTTTWTGAVSTAWGNIGNWSNGSPNPARDVIIAATPNQPILGGGNVTIKSLTLQAGTTLNINTPATLNIDNTIQNNGTLSIEGTVNLTSALTNTDVILIGNGGTLATEANISNTGTITGNNPSTLDLIGTANQTITGSGTIALDNCTINKTTGQITFDHTTTSIAQDFTVPLGVTLSIAANRNLTLNNNLIYEGVFDNTPLNSSLTFGGTTNSNLLGSVIPIFRNLLIDKAGGGSLTIDEDLTVLEDIRINSGTLSLTSGFTLSMAGNFTNNGTLLNSGDLSTIEFTGVGNNQVAGTTSTTFETLLLTKTSGQIIFEQITIIDENFTLPANVELVVRENMTLSLQDDFTHNGSIMYIAGGGYVANSSIQFTGTKNSVISGATIPYFRNLIINKAGGGVVDINTDVDLYINIRIDNGVVNLEAGRTFSIRGNFTRNAGGTFNAGTNSTVLFNGEIESLIQNGSVTFYNLIIDKSAAGPATSADTRVRIASNNVSVTVSNTLTLTRGRFLSTYATRLLILAAGATTTAPTAISFVEGPMRKIGNTAFTFPIGKNGRYGRLSITPTTAGAGTDSFTAEYFGTNFGNSSAVPALFDVTDREYWRLERIGTTTASVTLHWEDGANTSGLSAPLEVIAPANLRIGQWENTLLRWEDRGNTGTTGSVNTAGTISSDPGQNIFVADRFWTFAQTNDNTNWSISSWVGNVSSDWHDENNWSPAVLPTIINDVWIIGERPNQPVISAATGNVTIKSLTIPLNVSPTKVAMPPATLTVDATLSVTVGNSTITGIIDNSGTITNNGTITASNSFFNRNNAVLNNNGSLTATQNAGSFINGTGNGSTATVNNNGTITVTGNRRFDNDANATFNNNATGILVSNGAFRNRNNNGGGAIFNNNGIIRVSRDFTNDRPLNGIGTLNFINANVSNVNGTSPISQIFNITKTGSTINLQVNITATSNLTIPNNVTVTTTANTNTTIAGNFTNNGTLTPGIPSVFTFNTTSNTLISGASATTFYNVILNKTGGATTQINRNVTINNDLNINSGTTQINTGFTLSVGGNISNNAILTTQTNGTLEYVGGNSQTHSGTGSTALANLTMNKTAGTSLTLNQEVVISGNLNLNIGLINSSATHLLILNDNALTSTGNDNSYVNGMMRKIGDDAFTFPVGKSGKWARIAVSDLANTSVTDFFTAEYFTAPFGGLIIPPPIVDVSNLEHWTLTRGNTGGGSGTTEAKVSLYWEDGGWSGINHTASPDLLVVRGNGTSWENKGGDIIGTPASGNITTTARQAVFSPWTFASLSSTFNPLPLTLLSFTAKSVADKRVHLKWETVNEQNTAYFEIQRSQDGLDFTAIGQIPAAENSPQIQAYAVTDDSPLAGINYYRLKMVDLDNKFSYSNLAWAEIGQGNKLILDKIYPNPFKNEFTISFFAPKEAFYQVNLTNLQGIKVWQAQGKNDLSPAIIHSVQLPNLPNGVYLINIQVGAQTLQEKLLKIE